MQSVKKSRLAKTSNKTFNAKLLYIKLSKYLHMFSIVGIVYFFLNESIEHALIYLLFCFVFYFLSFLVFYNINSIFIKLNFIFFYIGYLLSMPIVFFDSDNYREIGWNAVGFYKFDYLQTFDALAVVIIYLSLFVIIALIFDKLLLKPYKENTSYNFNNYFKTISYYSKYRSVFIALIILQCFLSYIMFTYKIGVVGIIPETNLPFRIVGILYYYRYLIIPIIMFLLIFSNHNKKNNFILFLVLIEVLVSGIFSVSRVIIVLHLLPAILFLIYKERKVALGWVVLYAIVTMNFVTISREFVYTIDDFHSVNLSSLFDYYKLYDHTTYEWLRRTVFSMVTRVLGYREFLPTYFSDLRYIDTNIFFNLHLGFNFLNIGDFNVTRDIFKVGVPADKSFGMSLDPFSLLYVSTKNALNTLALFFFWVLYLILTEKIFNIALKAYRTNIVFILFLNFYMFLGYILPIAKSVFFLFPVLLLLAHILIPRKKIH